MHQIHHVKSFKCNKTEFGSIVPDKKKRRFKLIKMYVKCMSNKLAAHLACVLNAFDMHFNALKTLRSFTSLNEIKRKKITFV